MLSIKFVGMVVCVLNAGLTASAQNREASPPRTKQSYSLLLGSSFNQGKDAGVQEVLHTEAEGRVNSSDEVGIFRFGIGTDVAISKASGDAKNESVTNFRINLGLELGGNISNFRFYAIPMILKHQTYAYLKSYEIDLGYGLGFEGSRFIVDLNHVLIYIQNVDIDIPGTTNAQGYVVMLGGENQTSTATLSIAVRLMKALAFGLRYQQIQSSVTIEGKNINLPVQQVGYISLTYLPTES